MTGRIRKIFVYILATGRTDEWCLRDERRLRHKRCLRIQTDTAVAMDRIRQFVYSPPAGQTSDA